MTYAFTGPSFAGLFPGLAIGAGIGKLYQSIAQTDSSPMYLLMIRQVAEFAFYQIAMLFLKSKTPAAVIYAVTNLVVNSWLLRVFLQKQLIGTLGTVIVVTLMAIEFFAKTLDFSKFRTL